ncbi:MAG: hypothetical protein OEM22_08395 [Acidimicrobiia bacterium]|nr:hypothetical protein [Acidimicrobiia bacterium]MDH3470475.1 hypothetical protein [Acidimicrobiia bacterium]
MANQETTRSSLTGIRLPIPWDDLGFVAVPQFDGVAVTTGAPGWSWDGTAPRLGVPEAAAVSGEVVDGWSLDHVVLLVPDIEVAVAALDATGHSARLRMAVKGRPTAFFRVGTVLEVIESSVPSASLYGLALATAQPLVEVIETWRHAGLNVGDPHDAVQPGRSIFSVADLDAGLAVMTPDTAAEAS